MCSMTPKQFRDALKRLDMTQQAAARFLDVDERTVRRWVADDVAIPETVAKLLRVMIRFELQANDVV